MNDPRLTSDDYVWVEVTSHRGRFRLMFQVLNGSLPFAYRPRDIFKSGEYYRIHSRHIEAASQVIGVKLRKRLTLDDVSQCWGYEPGEREAVAA